MKSISNFAKDYTENQNILEYRTKKNPEENDIDIKDVQGKKADARGAYANGEEYPLEWGVDEPTDDDLLNEYTEEELNDSPNVETLFGKFVAEDPFFVQGEAGWGKTSIIKDMAKRFGRSVITVYLDKAVATDLGGIPVPLDNKKGGAKQSNLLPPWAQILEDNPDKKFLLFFDEMNQAQPDVQNALMPIVLENTICGKKFGKKDSKGKVIESNFFVGAAGNFEHENRAVFDMSGPLMSRFKPIIIWESDWKSAFKFVRKKWSGKISENIFKLIENNLELFDNPRELDQKLFGTIIKWKENPKKGRLIHQGSYVKLVDGLSTEKEISRKAEKVKEVANALYEFVQNDESEPVGRSKFTKDKNMIPPEIIKKIGDAMVKGYMRQVEDGKNVYYGISRENIVNPDIFEEEDGTKIMNAEMIERAIRKLEAEGKKFRFKTDKEWQTSTERKYKDPMAD